MTNTSLLQYYGRKSFMVKARPTSTTAAALINDKMKVETFLRLYFVVHKPTDD